MNKLYIQQEIINVGNDNIILPCRCISIANKNNCTEQQSQFQKYFINKHNNLYKYCNSLNIINTIFFSQNDLELGTNRTKILETDHNFCILLDTDKLIKETFLSYANDKTITTMNMESCTNIVAQLLLDFPRMELYTNGKLCCTISELNDSISKFEVYHHNIMISVYYLIILLCTQSSFFYPFSIIHNIYTLEDLGIYILPHDDYPNINIIHNHTSIDMVFKKTFKYVNINSNEIITKFHTFMVITINLVKFGDKVDDNHQYARYTKKYSECSGILYWIKDDNLLII